MSLPSTLRVKISSEGIESAAFTPVVARDMATEELVRLMLGVTGKDVERIRELLSRGSLVSGASRFRWTGIAVDPASISQVLASFPDSDPSRIFDPSLCTEVVLGGSGTRPLTIERDAGSKKRLFRKRSFWDELMALVHSPVYVDYSYKERADIFRQRLDETAQKSLREAAKLLSYSTYERQIASGEFTNVDLRVPR